MANTIVQSSVPLSASVAGTTGALSVTIGTGLIGRCIYLTGFSYQGSGATAATTVTITASYAPISGAAITLGTWVYPVPAQATPVVSVPLEINLIPPFQGNQAITGATNSTTTTAVGSITVSTSAEGTAAIFAGLNAWGYAL